MKELVPNDDPVTGIGDFYDFLWGEQVGFIYLATKDRLLDDKDPKGWAKTMFPWPEHRIAAINFTLGKNAEGLDVYMCPSIFNAARPVKENVKGSYVLWADFDGNAPESWPDESGPLSEQERPSGARSDDPATAPPPTLRIKSSLQGHEHTYWHLDFFCEDVEFIESTNRAIAYRYGADKGGWDINQVLRPIHTTNYKRKQPVTLEASTDKQYTTDHFKSFSREKQVAYDSIEIKDVPSVERVIAKYKWDDNNFNLFMQAKVEDGKRSSALMALGYFGAETGMADMEIYALLDHADKRWGKFTGRHNRDWYLLDIITKARKKHPVGGDNLIFRGLIGDAPVEEAPELILDFMAFNATEYKFEWIIEGLLERQGMALLASAPGLGKTQMSLQFGICAALGRRFLIWDIPKPMKVLFFSLEMNGPSLQHFTKQMASRYTLEEQQKISENFFILPEYHALPLDKDEGRAALEAMIKEFQPDGIILDSMGKLTGESLSDEKKAKQLNTYYAALRRSYNLFLWFVHHNRKANGDNKQPKDLQDIYGNQYIAADVTSALSLWQGVDGLEVNIIKSRLSKQEEVIKVVRTESLHFEVEDDNPSFLGLTGGKDDGPNVSPSNILDY